ncbi:hypothetical protein CRM22_002750 [Opisthorchis felineus]|uniref:Phosphatidic acid phosphatase type 2/haloperoxidase domain-containing protein n=1 Tax=Opisthorchis felineus TaxID=147828 RepID=A0A4S2M4L0_OPIFE|nr:hypothetical protein CRM22_002750 [Opisthorchis felineus]
MVHAETKRLIVRVVSDTVIVSLLHLCYFIISAAAGFSRLRIFCDDDSLRYPYKSDTVTIVGCAFYAYLLPVLTVIVLEVLLAVYNRYTLHHRVWKMMAFLMYNFVITFLMAAGVCLMLTNLIKYTLGRPRPHFWDVCQPDVCPTRTGVAASYTCRGTNKDALDDLFKSFVSGHSSLAAVGSTYAVLYLQERLHLTMAPMVRPLIQVVYVSSAAYIAMSRYADHKHHPWDIIAGVLLGSFIAFVLVQIDIRLRNNIDGS